MNKLIKTELPDSLFAIFQGAFLSIFARIMLLVTNLIIGIVLARHLGPSVYGIYSLIISLVTVLSLFSCFGLPTVALKETASYLEKKNWSLMKGLMYFVVFFVLCASFIAIIIGFGLKNVFPALNYSSLNIIVLTAFLLIPLFSFSNVFGDLLRGLHVLYPSQLSLIVKQLVFLGIILVLLLASPNISLMFAISANVIASIIALAMLIILFIAHYPNCLKSIKSEYRCKLWFFNALPMLAIAAIQIINNRADIIMLGIMRTSYEVGIYDVAMRGSELILFIQIAFSISIASTISKLHTKNKILELSSLIKRVTLTVVFLTMPIAILLVIFGGTFIGILFGEEYIVGVLALQILIFGHVFNILSGPSDLVLNMSGQQKFTARSVAIAAVVNVVLNVLLIPKYGVEGACVATLISTVLWNVLLVIQCRIHIGVDTTVLGRKPSLVQ